MSKDSADPPESRLGFPADTTVIQFGILCCAVTMIVVLVVALMHS